MRSSRATGGRALLTTLVALSLGTSANAQVPTLSADAMARVVEVSPAGEGATERPAESRPLQPQAKGLGPRVVIIGRRGEGDPPPRAAVDDLFASIAEGLERSGARVVEGDTVGVRRGTCMDGSCVESLSDADIDYVLWAMLTASDRDYTLDLRLELLGDPSEASAFAERCALCGLAEACERIEEGASTLLSPFEVEPAESPHLVLATEPSGARVVLDGEFVGRAPVERVLSPGAHRIEVSAEGYSDSVHVAEAAPGQRLDVSLSLSKLTPPPLPPPEPRLNGWIPIGVGAPTLAGGIVLAALDGRPPLGCGSDSGGCTGRLETIWPAAGMLVAGAALTSLGAVLVHQLRRSRRAKAAAKRAGSGAKAPKKKKNKKK